MQLIVNNDEMLGRTNESSLRITLMEQQNTISEVYGVISSILDELNTTGEAEQVVAKLEYCCEILKPKR